jgi:phage gp37-like protein
MIPVKDIQDAWIADINAHLKGSLGINTVDTHQPEYDNRTLAELMVLTPFVLLRYGRLQAVESERAADGGSVLRRQEFSLVFGDTSLLSSEEARAGCYAMLDAFRDRYDGGTLVVPDKGQIDLQLEEEMFLDSDGGVVAYYAIYSFVQY